MVFGQTTDVLRFCLQAPKDLQDDDLVSSLPMRKKAKQRTVTLIGSDDAGVQQVSGRQIDGNLIDDFDIESLGVSVFFTSLPPFSPLDQSPSIHKRTDSFLFFS